MLSKNEIKYIQSLGHKKNRDEEGVFIAEGAKIAGELIAEIPGQIVRLFATEVFAQNHNLEGVDSRLTIISQAELERISQLQTPNQVIVIAKQFEQVPLPAVLTDWALALDAIRDPGNMGTIIRLADWFGIKNILVSPDCVDIYNPKTVQASMGSLWRTGFYEADLCSLLKTQTVPVVAASLDGEKLSSFSFPPAGILVIGNESEGISKTVFDVVSHTVTIPKFGEAESLNAAIATGILLWELRR
jgi:TrmH family RNA methyltransferase